MMNKFYCVIFLFLFGFAYGSDGSTMSALVVGNEKYPLKIELKYKKSKILIVAPWDNLENFIIQKTGTNKDTSITNAQVKEKNPELYSDLKLILHKVSREKNNTFFISKNESAYEDLSKIFKYFTHYHWTAIPVVSNMPLSVPSPLTLEYPENASVLDLKKLIYKQLTEFETAETSAKDFTIKNKLYNILINKDGTALNDDVIMKDINSLDVQEQSYFSLRLHGMGKSGINLNNDTFDFYFTNPPCISINNIPSINTFNVTVQKITEKDASTSIEITVKKDEKDQGMASIKKDKSFIEEFEKLKNQSDSDFAFLKKSLSKWAQALGKTVSFQGEALSRPTTSSSQQTQPSRPSFFNRLKTWLQQKAASIVVVGIGLTAIFGTLYKSNPNLFNTPTRSWFDVWWHKGSSTAPAQPSASVSSTK